MVKSCIGNSSCIQSACAAAGRWSICSYAGTLYMETCWMFTEAS